MAAEAAWTRGVRRPAMVLATGLGKTVIFSHAVSRFVRRERGRALILAHRTELVEQAAAKFRSVAPDLRVGVVMGARNETLGDAVVASVQTLGGSGDGALRRRRMLRDIGLIVVDEAHHAAAATYVRTLEHYGCFGPERSWDGSSSAVALGVTATMVRGDGLALGDVWQDIVATRDIAFGVEEGFLVRPYCVRVRVDDLDLSRVKGQGDFDKAELGAAIEASMAPEAIVKALREHATKPDGTLMRTALFAPLISTASVIMDALRAEGIRADLVCDKTPAGERKRILADSRAGRIDVVCNAMVLTEGYDDPGLECVVVARPTKSPGLFVQMVGRGLRPAPGKSACLVLDVVGVTRSHSLGMQVDLFGAGDVQERQCGRCGLVRGECECPVPDIEDLGGEELGAGDEDLVRLFGPFAGKLHAEVVDLFSASESAWGRTAAGIWFLSAGERFIAVLPADPARMGGMPGFDVVSVHKYRVGESRWVQRDVSELSWAMGWAEGDVTPAEALTAARGRSWRAKRPSEKQLALARRLGVLGSEDMRAGELSQRMAVIEASRRIDRRLPTYVELGV